MKKISEKKENMPSRQLSDNLRFDVRIPILELNRFLGFILSLVLWITISLSPCEIDSAGYKVVFYQSREINITQVEYGFYLITQLAHNIGINYWAFRSIFIGIAFILLTKAINRLNADILRFYICFAIFPLLYIVIQIRFFFAVSLVITGLSFMLTDNNTTRGRFAFIAFVIMGTLFHSSVILFLIYLIPVTMNDAKFRTFFIVSIVLEIFMLLFFNRFSSFVTSLILFFRKLVTYYRIDLNLIDWFQFTVTYILMAIIAIVFLKNLYMNSTEIIDENSLDREYIEKKNICIVNILLVGLTMLNSTFSRYFQASIIVILVFIMNKYGNRTKYSIILRSIYFLIIAFLAYFFIHGMIWKSWTEAFFKINGFHELFKMR